MQEMWADSACFKSSLIFYNHVVLFVDLALEQIISTAYQAIKEQQAMIADLASTVQRLESAVAAAGR